MPIDDKEAGTCFSYTVQQMLNPKPTDAELELKDTWDRIHFMREIENVLEEKLQKWYEDDLLKDLGVSQLLLDTFQTRETRFQHVWDERRRLYEKLSEIEENQRKEGEYVVEAALMIIFKNIDPELPEGVIQLIAEQICK